MEQQHRHGVIVTTVHGQEFGDVQIREVVRIDNNHVICVTWPSRICRDGPGRTEKPGLERFHRTESLLVLFRDVLTHRLREMMSIDQYVTDTCVPQCLVPVIQQGPAGDWHQTLRYRFSDRSKPGAQ